MSPQAAAPVPTSEHVPPPPASPGALGGRSRKRADKAVNDPGSEARLRESEARYRQLADAMPQLVWTATADGVVDYYNARVEEYAGIRQRPDGTWSWELVVHPDDAEATHAEWRRAVQTGERYEIEHRVRMRDGEYRWHISRGAPARGADGSVRWFGTATDIHAMRMAQDAANESQERLHQAIQVANLGVFEHDHETGGTYWSSRVRSIFGFEPAEALSLEAVLGLLHSEDRDAVLAAIRQATDPAGDGSFQAAYRFRRRDGSVGWAAVRSRTFFRGQGRRRRPSRTIGAVAEITERREAEDRLRESEERLRLATEVANFGTYEIDLDSGDRYWSPPLREILGLSADDPVRPTHELVHPDDLPAVETTMAGSRDPRGDGAYRIEYRVRRPDGQTRWIVDQGRTLFEGEGARRRPRRMIGAVIDVTDRREAEELRDAFIGMLSHELRTPVTSIYGGSQVLRRPDLDVGLRSEILEGVIEESERLVRLVENLLVIAKVERHAVLGEREPVLVRGVIGRVIGMARREHPGRELRIVEQRSLPAVVGDEGAIELVLRNLVSNALKYGPPAGHVTITTDAEDGMVLVRVRDQGPGLQVENPDRLFDLFYRVQAAKRVAPGAGIGLYVARALVQAMHGRIWARNLPEGGAEFGFGLPVMTERDVDYELTEAHGHMAPPRPRRSRRPS